LVAEAEKEKLGAQIEIRREGAPLKNANAVKHGHYRTKSKDVVKTQRIRRRVNRRLQGVPSDIRAVMRPVTYALVEIEDRLEAMREYLDEVGIVNDQGEPRKRRHPPGDAMLRKDNPRAGGIDGVI